MSLGFQGKGVCVCSTQSYSQGDPDYILAPRWAEILYAVQRGQLETEVSISSPMRRKHQTGSRDSGEDGPTPRPVTAAPPPAHLGAWPLLLSPRLGETLGGAGRAPEGGELCPLGQGVFCASPEKWPFGLGEVGWN